MGRGQAFEVFRLLIAAVIAGAILMVLLSILGPVRPLTQNPDDFVKQSIKNLAREGGARTSQPVVFDHGMLINLRAAAAAAVIDPSCVCYVDQTGGWKPASYDDYVLEYSGAKLRGQISVVCSALSGSASPYCSSCTPDTCNVCCKVVFSKVS